MDAKTKKSMGKRLTRINGIQIKESLPQILGLEATIVLQNGSTFHGIINGLKDKNCLLNDFRNYPHTILIEQIAEIITDKVSSY